MRVDFPDPLPPSRAWIWPGATSKETSISARVPGKVLDRWAMRRAGPDGGAPGAPPGDGRSLSSGLVWSGWGSGGVPPSLMS